MKSKDSFFLASFSRAAWASKERMVEALFEFERAEIGVEGFEGEGVFFNKCCVGSAIAEGFDAHGSAASEKIEYMSPLEIGAEGVKDRLADEGRRRTRLTAFRRLEGAASELTG